MAPGNRAARSETGQRRPAETFASILADRSRRLCGRRFRIRGVRVSNGGRIDGLEKTRLTLGFVPLTDCAPLVVVRDKGFFEARGLTVELSREASWATIRDKVAVEALDGAQMLAAMPLAATLGLDGLRAAMVSGLSLDLNGNSIVLSRELWAEMAPDDASPAAVGGALARAVAARAACGSPSLRLAVTFPHSSHNYLLRYWLAASGIDPDADVRLTVVPPRRMVAHLIDGDIDGYCVGAPWGQIAVDLGIGRVALATYDVWNNHPEKCPSSEQSGRFEAAANGGFGSSGLSV